MTYSRIKQPEAVLLDESNSSARTDFAEAGISAANGHRLVPLLVWLGVVLTLILIPLKIVSYGYL
ncbi:MAG TPA: hypothetical protein VGR78_01815, partial [Verrucomicrobiae bacterium]|nr:hypothetical protein [Verrucomicrobiae bacterium]